MRWLKRLLITLLILVLLPAAAFWGLKQNFPGENLAQVLEAQALSQAQVPLKVAPLQLGWTQLELPEVAMLPPATWQRAPQVKLLVLNQLRAPFLPLLSRDALLEGDMHGGSVELRASGLPQPYQVQAQVKDVQLNRVPLVALFPYGTISGRTSAELEIRNVTELLNRQAALPVGDLKGDIQNLRLRLSGLDLILPGMVVPDLVWPLIRYDVTLGDQVVLNELTLQGSVNGTVTGTIRPNVQKPVESQIDLRAQITLPAEILQSLGPLALMLRPYQCGVELRVRLQGTPARPITRPGACS